jgi:hypothetical protein
MYNRLDRSELVEISHKDDDGKSSQNRGGVLPKRSNPVALLIDSVQHGETDHADLVNEQSRPPLLQRVDLRLDSRTGAIEDIDTEGSVDGTPANVVRSGA